MTPCGALLGSQTKPNKGAKKNSIKNTHIKNRRAPNIKIWEPQFFMWGCLFSFISRERTPTQRSLGWDPNWGMFRVFLYLYSLILLLIYGKDPLSKKQMGQSQKRYGGQWENHGKRATTAVRNGVLFCLPCSLSLSISFFFSIALSLSLSALGHVSPDIRKCLKKQDSQGRNRILHAFLHLKFCGTNCGTRLWK